MNMNITSIKEEITASISNRTLSYNLTMEPGLYDVSLFVWADGSLGLFLSLNTTTNSTKDQTYYE